MNTIGHLFAQQIGDSEKEKELMKALLASAQEGHHYLLYKENIPSSHITSLSPHSPECPTLIGRWENRYYLQRHWKEEQAIAQQIVNLLSRSLTEMPISSPRGLTARSSPSPLCLSAFPQPKSLPLFFTGRSLSLFLPVDKRWGAF